MIWHGVQKVWRDLHDIRIATKSSESKNSLTRRERAGGVVNNDSRILQTRTKGTVSTNLIGGRVQSKNAEDIGKIQANGSSRYCAQHISSVVLILARRLGLVQIHWAELQLVE